ncbi:MAG: dTDP-4-dehydrorhamnose 3,5-epimerase [Paracoccaceae bacterium]
MKIKRFTIDGPCLVTPPVFGDSRGWFSETYNATALAAVGISDVFVQDNHSYSAKTGTLRGLHFQVEPHAQAKLVRVVAGAITDIIVDIRPNSPSFGEHVSVNLSAKNRAQLYVPKGFAHGFITRQANTELCYKVSGFYAPDCDRGIAWDDPELGLDWGFATPFCSDKDSKHPTLSDYLERQST